ncbi:MAG: SDR family oxidoreductase [Candidatus Curtissbacteria bacterium]
MKKTVLITGASGGIGLELARVFAQNKYDLVLVARSRGKLLEIKKELEQKNGVSVFPVVQDLTLPGAPEDVYKKVKAKKIKIDVLVNNAGFGAHGKFTETNLEDELGSIHLNVLALTALTKFFVLDMAGAKKGKILNVASTAAFIPSPVMAVYHATKAYVLSFSEALAVDLKGKGIVVCALCPGPVETGFAERAGMGNSLLFKTFAVDAKDVARAGYAGLMQGKMVVVPGFLNNVSIFIVRFSPRTLVLKITGKLQA